MREKFERMKEKPRLLLKPRLTIRIMSREGTICRTSEARISSDERKNELRVCWMYKKKKEAEEAGEVN